MLEAGDVFFYEQTSRWRPPRRYRKLPDELPQSMKFAHLNRSVQAYLQSKEKEDGDGGGAPSSTAAAAAKDVSLLPDINHAIGLLKSHLDEADGGGGGGEFARAQYYECRGAAGALLELLARWLTLLQQSGRRLQLPRSLEHQLQCCYEELCAGAMLVRREWQLPANAAAARKAEKAKADESLAKGDGPDGGSQAGQQQSHGDDDASSVRKAGPAAGYGRDEPDSDGDGGKDGKASVLAASSAAPARGASDSGMGTGRSGRHRLLAAGSDDRSSRGHSRRSHADARRRATVAPATAAAAGGRRTAVAPSATALETRLSTSSAPHRADDAASSVGTPSSAKSTIGPQPYSVAILQFNLSNVRALEDKGCKVYGMEEGDDGTGKDATASSPLEWAVRRLSAASRAIRAESAAAMTAADGGTARSVPFVRYYGDKVVSDRQLEKSYAERLGVYSALIRGEPIKVPQVPQATLAAASSSSTAATSRKTPGGSGRQAVMMVQTSDGSQCAFYETGHLALAMSAGAGDGGFYTMAFDEARPTPRMVACFTPQGRGSCYYSSGALRYVSNDSGGTLYNEDGECEHFQWPANGKLPNPITFPLGRCLSLRILGQHQMFLVFSTGNFTLKISVSKAEKSTTINVTDSPQLQTFDGEYDFESDYALDLMNQRTLRNQQAATSEKKPDKRLVFKLKAVPSTMRKADVKVLDNEVDFMKLEKDLDRLKAKSRLLIDDWMETYRIATGMMSPHISRLRDGGVAAMLKSGVVSRSGGAASTHSAKSTPGGFLPSAVGADEDSTSPIPIVSEEERRRVPSAPCNVSMWSLKQEEDEASRRRDGQSVQFDGNVKFSDAPDNTATATGDTGQATPRQQPQPQISVSSAVHSGGGAWSTGNFAPWAAPPRGQCPVALRLELMGRGAMPCRCQRRKIPYITDVEFDEFTQKTAPPRQLVIVAVMSSLYPDEKSAGILDMLEKMHSDRNAHRAMPCLQARSDPFRIFRYDLATAHFDTGLKQALLIERHGASAGMFLIYESGRLLFCDRVFNGYSNNARSDFQKQLNECRRLAVAGCSLPADFKFSSAKHRHGAGGSKSMHRTDGSATGERFLMPLGSKGVETTAGSHSISSATPAPVEYTMGIRTDDLVVSHPGRKPHHQDSIAARLQAVKMNQSAPPQQRFYKGSAVLAHSAR